MRGFLPGLRWCARGWLWLHVRAAHGCCRCVAALSMHVPGAAVHAHRQGTGKKVRQNGHHNGQQCMWAGKNEGAFIIQWRPLCGEKQYIFFLFFKEKKGWGRESIQSAFLLKMLPEMFMLFKEPFLF